MSQLNKIYTTHLTPLQPARESWRDSHLICGEDYRVITPGNPIEFHQNLLLANIDRYLMISICFYQLGYRS